MAYQRPEVTSGALRLHFNENTAGCSPAVLAALRDMTRADAAFYPEYGDITARTARWLGVEPERVLLTNGLDEGLHLVAQWAVWHSAEHGAPAEVIVPEPAFEMYAACAEAVRATVVRVMPQPEFAFALDGILAAITSATRVIYLTDPNNPTGRPIPAGAIERIAMAAPRAIVLVDEAYADFSGRTAIGPLLDRTRNVIIGRTFAKGHGLAALRVGALVAHPDTLARIRPLQPPYSLNAWAITALGAALGDRAYVEWYVGQSADSRARVYAWAARLGLAYWPSEANFVLVRVGDRATEAAAALAARGILVRDKSSAPGCAGCLRITSGVVEHTDRCLEALEEFLAPRTN
jgi:histidinol-phosphate aminotransferase